MPATRDEPYYCVTVSVPQIILCSSPAVYTDTQILSKLYFLVIHTHTVIPHTGIIPCVTI